MRFARVLMDAVNERPTLRLDEVAVRAGLTHQEGIEAMNGLIELGYAEAGEWD